MNIWELDKLVLFVALFLPGFISIRVYDLIIAGPTRDFSKAIPEAISYSAINLGFSSWILILVHQDSFYQDHLFWYLASIVLVFFVLPAAWPLFFIWLRRSTPLAQYVLDPMHQPWDHVFSTRRSRWVIVHLQDGRKIGGKYGLNSRASAFPRERQLYLSELWEISSKGQFLKKVPRTDGLLVFESDIKLVEFFT